MKCSKRHIKRPFIPVSKLSRCLNTKLTIKMKHIPLLHLHILIFIKFMMSILPIAYDKKFSRCEIQEEIEFVKYEEMKIVFKSYVDYA